MNIDLAVYEDEFYDSDDVPFQKTASRKEKGTKHTKEDSVRKQRKAKGKQREHLLYELGNR